MGGSWCLLWAFFVFWQGVEKRSIFDIKKHTGGCMGLVVLVTAMLLVSQFYQAQAQPNNGSGSDRVMGESSAQKGAVVDLEGKVITEEEISREKTQQKFWVYTLSGAVISLGTSFFAASMIARSSDKGIKDAIVYSGTAAGTLSGTFFLPVPAETRIGRWPLTGFVSNVSKPAPMRSF